jgi:ketosteroid isomerase-like protein
VVDRAHVGAWIDGYERAWRTAGTETLASLFTDDATYSMSPYEDAVRGLPAIADLWDREREGPDESFTMSWEHVAFEGDIAVVRLEVHYAASGNEFRDLWVVRFGSDGRCTSFEEWPFWPGKGHSHPSNENP